MIKIKSRSHEYAVELFSSIEDTLKAIQNGKNIFYLIDDNIARIYKSSFSSNLYLDKCVFIKANEKQKSYEKITPIFLDLLRLGLKRDGVLIVIGGGVTQDIGSFICSVLFRGISWELIPTTLLAQADSCIGSKSSINIGTYKNQIGTFYPPKRVLITSSVLTSLPFNEVRSGLGEIIKLQLLNNEVSFRNLMQDLSVMNPVNQSEIIAKWVIHSLEFKKTFIEEDEFDLGIRNKLNYGHTFGHAYESASSYRIPHGIAVILGILTATYLSVRLNLIDQIYFNQLNSLLKPWYSPFEKELKASSLEIIFHAIQHDKKNTAGVINCILTEGTGQMSKIAIDFEGSLKPAVTDFIENEI